MQAVEDSSNRARMFLEKHLFSVLNDKYDLAIVTYALHVAGSLNASDALAALDAMATVEGDVCKRKTFWRKFKSCFQFVFPIDSKLQFKKRKVAHVR